MPFRIIECVPNFSEGRNAEVIKAIADAMASVNGVKVLDVDAGKATNRTVVTLVGEPEQVVAAAFKGIQKAAELIDMSNHQGEHPRMGATDVCPLIPISGVTMEETVGYAHQLAKQVGEQLGIPCFLYEAAATRPERKNLASIRAGEYEGLPAKLQEPAWQPDYGQAVFNPKAGATVIGVRDFLIAFNVNLNTTSVRRANSVAFDVREKGRVLRLDNPVTGKIVTDENGKPVRQPGVCKSVKAIGWFIEEYGVAQVSMNLTDLKETPLHRAFEACCESAQRRGMRVTGSELVGMMPLEVLLDAGRYFLKQQQRSTGVSDSELIKIAVKTMGLDELAPFDPQRRIIEYQLATADPKGGLVNLTLAQFADETASESPAPGGGSVAAYVGTLGIALATMVANLSAHKRGWEERWENFSTWAEKGQKLKKHLLALVDEDTHAFNALMDAFKLPKTTPAEKQLRDVAIQTATQHAIKVPFKVMKLSLLSMEMMREMALEGNPNSISDVGVGVLCARCAVRGALLNVQINASSIKDKVFANAMLEKGETMVKEAERIETSILEIVKRKI